MPHAELRAPADAMAPHAGRFPETPFVNAAADAKPTGATIEGASLGYRSQPAPKAAFAAMGAEHALDPDGTRHPGMHKTDTVDFAIVLSGEIWALLDEGETLLRAGNTLVQRGTNHAWSNRSAQPCLVAFILVSAAPLRGKPRVKLALRTAARAGRGVPSRPQSRGTTARPRRHPRPR